MSHVTDQRAAQAAYQVEEHAASIDLHLCTSDRTAVVDAHAVQLLADYGGDPAQLARIAAEAIAVLVEERLAARGTVAGG